MAGGFHSIKTGSAHRIRAREAFDPGVHRRTQQSAREEARAHRRRQARGLAAVLLLAAGFAAAWQPASAWRTARASEARLERDAAREARRHALASDEAFARESLISDGREAVVFNTNMAAPLTEAVDGYFAHHAGRTYARQALRHGAVLRYLDLCGDADARLRYRTRNAATLARQESYRRDAGAAPLPAPRVLIPVDPATCRDVAGVADSGGFDLRLD